MRTNRPYFTLAIVAFLLIVSCQKKEFTEPVSVNLNVRIADGASAHFTFDKGIISVEQILFDGHRQQGGSVHFATNTDAHIGLVEFTDASAGSIKTFDIPQGVYTNMQWRFILKEMALTEEEDDDDDDDFDEMEDGGLVVSGAYNNDNGERIPLYIIVDEDEQMLVTSQNEDAYSDITLTSEKTYQAQLIVNPFYAVQTISNESMSDAEISTNAAGDYIEISEDNNEALYEIIVYRLESSLKVVVN